MQRPNQRLSQRKNVLIVTNGEQEKIYFDIIRKRNKSDYKLEISKQNGNISNILDIAIAKKANNTYNDVWCVFDIDQEQAYGILQPAIQKARQNCIRLAYSNIAFEIWLIFHYKENIPAYLRIDDYGKEILDIINAKNIAPQARQYNKTDEKIIAKFVNQVANGKINSMRVYQLKVKEHEANNGNTNYPFWEWRSTTNIFQLIEKLHIH